MELESGRPLGRSPGSIILVPSIQLGQQIIQESLKLSFGTKVKSAISLTEVDSIEQELKLGCDILITTPEILVNYVNENGFVFENAKYLVFYNVAKRFRYREMFETIMEYNWESIESEFWSVS